METLTKSAPDFSIEADAPTADKLEALRNAVREQRDLEAEIAARDNALKESKTRLDELRFRSLPDLFMAAGVDSVGLAAEGNLPAYDAKLGDFYHANIATSWDADRRKAAFDWLEKNGHGDLIQIAVTVNIPRGELEKAKKLFSLLDEAGYVYSANEAVPWNTLTAFVKEQVSNGTVPPLETLGATVGKIVKLRERKEL